MKKILACSAVLLAAVFSATTTAAPTATFPISGQMQGSSETFSGIAMEYGVGAADVNVTTSMGAKCTGHYFFNTPQSGNGIYKCDDGRSGPLNLTSSGKRGSGSSSGVQQISFTFDVGSALPRLAMVE
jgi:hypothetical protein